MALCYLNKIGQKAERIWNLIPEKFDFVKLDVYQFMPDHFHAILIFDEAKIKEIA